MTARDGLPNLYNGMYILNISGLFDNCTATLFACIGMILIGLNTLTTFRFSSATAHRSYVVNIYSIQSESSLEVSIPTSNTQSISANSTNLSYFRYASPSPNDSSIIIPPFYLQFTATSLTEASCLTLLTVWNTFSASGTSDPFEFDVSKEEVANFDGRYHV